MATVRLALANLPFPASPAASVADAVTAIAEAGRAGAHVICFPETFIPGYRTASRRMAPPDAAFLDDAWRQAAAAAGAAGVTVVLGTERIVEGRHRISTLVVHADGTIAGFHDKVQLDPSEDGTWEAGSERHVYTAGPLTFGLSICHEGWRYPETVRWAVRRGAQVVFLPHFHEAEPGGFRPTAFADPANTFHEKAILCRAAENTCVVAAVNFASPGSPTTSAVARPDGTLLAFQPYGVAGLLLVDVDLAEATGLLASRVRSY
ncbi:MAG: carbon-nitrogen hydrolase family protein [Acidobacteria bacterium]|nr:carbon-nitrogen hydrolase family protein [Acidobacteriota bacterium]